MLHLIALVQHGHCCFFLPCDCGKHFDLCAGWQEVPLSAAAHLSVLAWTEVELLTPELHSYFFPRQIKKINTVTTIP